MFWDKKVHLSMEDMDKYLEPDVSAEYLVWLEDVENHLLNCRECQEKFQKFLLADIVSERFDGKVLETMAKVLESENEEEEDETSWFWKSLRVVAENTGLEDRIEKLIVDIRDGIYGALWPIQKNEMQGAVPAVVRGGELPAGKMPELEGQPSPATQLERREGQIDTASPMERGYAYGAAQVRGPEPTCSIKPNLGKALKDWKVQINYRMYQGKTRCLVELRSEKGRKRMGKVFMVLLREEDGQAWIETGRESGVWIRAEFALEEWKGHYRLYIDVIEE